VAQLNLHTHYQPDQPSVSPHAAESHSRGFGHGLASLRKHSLKVTAPLLLAGVCAVVFIVSAGGGGNKPLNNESTKSSKSEVNITHDTTTPDPAPSASSSTNIESNTSGQTGNATTHVTMNGEDVDVPQNGSIHKTVTNPDGSTSTLDVSTSNQGDASNQSSTSTNVNINNSSSSYSSSYSSTQTTGGGSSQ
jgi:hypothetical protein